MIKNHKKNIGLLGGTFNPPHSGHLRISFIAINRLKLDEIWWIVSLSNPLKKNKNVPSFDKRLENVRKFVKVKRIVVKDFEKSLESPYSVDLINYLKKKYPWRNFVWIMGVDNMINFHKWKDWKNLFYKVPIAIFDRPFYSLFIQKSKCLGFFKKYRLNCLKMKSLKLMLPPSWVFITGWVKNVSSTEVRYKKKT